MDQPTIYTHDEPNGRPATDQELAAILGGITASDGTSYLDIFNDARDED